MNRTSRLAGCVLISLSLLLPLEESGAQDPSGAIPQVIKVDLSTRTFASALPFDQVFVISAATNGAPRIELVWGTATDHGSGPMFDTKPARVSALPGNIVRKDAMGFRVILSPNRVYLFRFAVFKTDSTAGVPRREVVDTVLIRGIATADLPAHFGTDFGVVVAPRPGPAYSGAGTFVHLYLVPIHADEDPDAIAHSEPVQRVLKRVSLFAGLSVIKLAAGSKVDHLFSVGTPVFGVGVRPLFTGSWRRLNFVRLNAGMMLFNQPDPNPLIAMVRGKHAPFFSVTFDISLQSALAPIGGLLGGK